MKGYVLHLSWLHGVVPGIWVVVSHRLDHTSMSQMFVLHFYVISGGWLKILATSVCACKRLQFFRMILHIQIVEGWYRRLNISLFSAAVTKLGANIQMINYDSRQFKNLLR